MGARHCYVKFEEGMGKDEVVAYRNEICGKLPGAKVGRAPGNEKRMRSLAGDGADDRLGNDDSTAGIVDGSKRTELNSDGQDGDEKKEKKKAKKEKKTLMIQTRMTVE